MPYRNPWKARLAKWRKHWPQPIEELQAQAYAVLQVAYEGVSVEDDEQRRKNILCYWQGLTSFAKLLEGAELAELKARIDALESRPLEVSSNGASYTGRP